MNSIPNSGQWKNISTTLNENFSLIEAKMLRYDDMSTITKGYFLTEEDLKEAFPTSQVGNRAFVGSTAPYQIWLYSKENGWYDSGYTGSETSFDWTNIPEATISSKGLMSANMVLSLQSAELGVGELAKSNIKGSGDAYSYKLTLSRGGFGEVSMDMPVHGGDDGKTANETPALIEPEMFSEIFECVETKIEWL